MCQTVTVEYCLRKLQKVKLRSAVLTAHKITILENDYKVCQIRLVALCNLEVKHKPGMMHRNVDGLSRQKVSKMKMLCTIHYHDLCLSSLVHMCALLMKKFQTKRKD